MKNTIATLVLISIIVACNPAVNDHDNSANTDEALDNTKLASDTIPKVTGIGGIFFLAGNPAEVREWYGKNLGLEIDAYGSVFEFRNSNSPTEINYLRWSPIQDGNSYFDPSKKQFMINYRVQNIEGLVRNLKANNVTVLNEIVSYEYGKFVHILDPEGNKIELWEPVDSVLTALGGKTTK